MKIDKIDVSLDIDKIIEIYTVIFCTTRSGDRYTIREHYLNSINKLGLVISKKWGVSGAALKYARGYRETHDRFLNEILKKNQINTHPFYKSYLHFLNERYVGHRRYHTGRSGKIESTEFSVVATDDCTIRESGYISTFSQQTCVVVIGWDERNFGLGHWKCTNIEHARIFAEKWQNVAIVKRMSTPLISAKNLIEITFTEEEISSVKVTRTEGYVLIEHETHTPDEENIKYGPLIIQPSGNVNRHQFPIH